ncbi:MAG: Rne/Rng family ribonuclease [Actinomycetota bacterium]|nr:Rne/Rng family ribonuclease [Actinomycetota bacterium]
MTADTPRRREKAADVLSEVEERAHALEERARALSAPAAAPNASGKKIGDPAPNASDQPTRDPAPHASEEGASDSARDPAEDDELAVDPAIPDGQEGEPPVPAKAPGRGGRKTRRRGPRTRRKTSAHPADRVMLVHVGDEGIQIAITEQGVMVEFYVAGTKDRSLVGNIYLGRVQNVLPGMEASFIDFGEARNGVLYASEVGVGLEEGAEIPRIETVLSSGQPILVQVTKDPMRAKGARLTAAVSLAGRHLVLVPNAPSLGVSRRLGDEERERLRDIAARLRPERHGLIVRTAAEGAGGDDLERDLKRLMTLWENINCASADAQAPALLHQEPELELRVFRDLFNREVSLCVIDHPGVEAKLRDYVAATTPDLEGRIQRYDGELPLFEEVRITEQIRKSLDRRVWLPSGGHIVIERTEAMTVVDVNTGKFVGKSYLEQTVLRTNKEAAVEVVRQLRLRDIGGIIVIDFIDMDSPENRAELEQVFRQELERDRTRTQVFEMSPLGLIQMTRKNVSTGIVEAFSDPCPECEGRGILIHDVD